MADQCSECRRSPAVTTTVTGRPVCQPCANRLAGAAAGTVLGGPVQGIATGVHYPTPVPLQQVEPQLAQS